jgi:2-keto-4-pentenoate hydratase
VTDEMLLDLLEKSESDPDPAHDIERPATLTREDAYRLQRKWKQRKAEAGDAHVGYRVSLNSRKAMEAAVKLGLMPPEMASTFSPVYMSLSRSNIGTEHDVIEVEPDRIGVVEAEVGVVMAGRLEGPGITAAEAVGAIAGYLPAIDLARLPKQPTFGLVHMLAMGATPRDTTCVFGPTLSPPSTNMALEGILVSVNGEARASATAWEAHGHPINAVVWLANELAKVGAALEPGQLLICGVCAHPPPQLGPGDVTARADYTTLGGVTVRLNVPT